MLAAATAWKRSTTDLDGFAGEPGSSLRRSALLPVDRFQAYAADRFVALATVTLGSGVAMLDGTVVNIALPSPAND